VRDREILFYFVLSPFLNLCKKAHSLLENRYEDVQESSKKKQSSKDFLGKLRKRQKLPRYDAKLPYEPFHVYYRSPKAKERRKRKKKRKRKQ